MRAVVNTPAGETRVEVRERPDPSPAADQAVVAVESFSINRGELALLQSRPDGWQPGQDVAGTVIATAEDGSGPRAGTRVVGVVEQGGWAQRVAVPTGRLAILPDDVDTAHAAALPIAGLTALRTLALAGAVLGRRVLVTAAAGGVGYLQTQLAIAAGAEVLAVTRRKALHPALFECGASAVLDHISDAGGQFDVVLDGVGGSHLAGALTKLTPGGTVVLYGASDPQPAQLTLLDFIGHENATIKTYFSYADTRDDSRDLAALVRLLHTHQLTVRLGAHSPWTEINTILDNFADGRIDGKAVLDTN